MIWKEVTNLEKEIILLVRKKDKSISEIAKEVKTSVPNISQTVSRMVKDNILFRNKEYIKDARFSKVSINKDKIRIKKTHSFYYVYFFISFLLLSLSAFISFKTISIYFLYGSLLVLLPLFFYIVYYAYVMEDKIIVEKFEDSKELAIENIS
jgi:DNA-binding Lrp family transcriptional regulator